MSIAAAVGRKRQAIRIRIEQLEKNLTALKKKGHYNAARNVKRQLELKRNDLAYFEKIWKV